VSRHIPRNTVALSTRLKEVLPTALLALLASLLVLMSSAGQSTITWRGDFEPGNFSQWTAVQAKDPSRVTIQSDVVRQGRYATRFEVRPGDNNVAGSGTGERAQVYIGNVLTDWAEGREQYWAWSTYIPPDFAAPMGGWNALVGFHHTGTTGGGNVQIAVADMKTLWLRVMGADFEAPIRKDWDFAPLVKGKWYDFVLHVKWSSNASVGFVELWLNGSKVVPLTITPTLYYGQGVYLKMGYYRSAFDQTTVVYHDGMRRGSSYSEVAAEFPSSGEPLPSYAVSSNIKDGAALAGTTQWTASPSGRTTSSVGFSVDGKTIATDTTSPYGVALDTTALANGGHTFRVDATATDGAKASASAGANVNNLVPDPLAVTQNLSTGQTVSGTISWAASTFEREVSKVEFSVDGQLVASDGAAPYAISYDTTRVVNATHAFAVKGYATDGTTATASANVNVANSAAAPAPSPDPDPDPATGFSVTQNMSAGQQLSGTYKWVVSPIGKPTRRVVFSVDGRKVANEIHPPYEQAVDTQRYSDGRHDFEVTAVAQDGSEASAAATVTIANKAGATTPSAPSAPPPSPELTVSQSAVSGQTVSGAISWTASPSGQAVSKIEFWIDGDLKWTENLSPYVYGGDGRTLDTRNLANGSHTLEVRAFGSGGSTARASAGVKVSNTTEALVSSIADGQTITGLVTWAVQPEGFSVSRMEFFIDDKLMWTERLSPWVYGGDGRQLDTRTLTKGAHVLEIRATGTDGALRRRTLRVTVS
jgi:polysaccharide lyase-like protein/Big-like domain-containing protein